MRVVDFEDAFLEERQNLGFRFLFLQTTFPLLPNLRKREIFGAKKWIHPKKKFLLIKIGKELVIEFCCRVLLFLFTSAVSKSISIGFLLVRYGFRVAPSLVEKTAVPFLDVTIVATSKSYHKTSYYMYSDATLWNRWGK